MTQNSTRSTSGNPPLWRLVAEREVTTRVREKGFLVGLAVTVAFLVAFFVIGAFVGGSSSYHVAVTDRQAEQLVQQAEGVLQETGSQDDTLTATTVDDTAAAEAAVRDGDADAALLPAGDGQGWRLVGEDELDPGLVAAVGQTVTATTLAANAAQQDVDLDALNRGTQLQQDLLDPDAGEAGTRQTVSFAFSLVFLMTALGYGMTIAQSVLQERESRVVEILAAAIPIRALLWGKILGNTALALGQLLLLVAVGVGGLLVTGRGSLLIGIGGAVVWYVAFFVLGFLALAALWSVAGSLAARQEDLQSTTLPMQMLLFVPYFVSAFGSDGVMTIASMVPISSTMVMPGRMATGDVPGWQVAVAVVGTVLAAVAFVRLGSRLYERTLLHTGGKLSYREALALPGRR